VEFGVDNASQEDEAYVVSGIEIYVNVCYLSILSTPGAS
jgi:hypothetical protein